MNSGGTRKSISSAYANISGTRKQIFPYSATTIYTWNKYNVNESISLGSGYSGYSVSLDWGGPDAESAIFYGSSYTISGSEFYISGESEIDLSTYNASAVKGLKNTLSNKYWQYRHNYSDGVYRGTLLYGCTNVSCSSGNPASFTCSKYYTSDSVTITTSRGSYIGQVTSSNKSTYPTDGVSGSYWYVFVS